MLGSLTSLFGYVIRATDGDIGNVNDFLFEDDTWVLKYLVVKTGAWLHGRRVLITPAALGQPDWSSHSLPVKLTRIEVQNSPDINADMPVSLQQLTLLHEYYGWPAYAAGTGFAYIPMAPPQFTEQEKEQLAAIEKASDPHLRSARQVTGYRMQAIDGGIGHVDDFIVNSASWVISSLVVDTGKWLTGKKVLISPQAISAISWGERRVHVDLTTDAIKNSPEYDPTTLEPSV